MLKNLFLSLLLAAMFVACNSNSDSVEDYAYTNALVNETSPYLLQHAHNPVNWYAWNDSTLAKAKRENKLMLISVGYAACHWCHVMERESFEDTAVAKVMNANFINIKVDREERPDVDQVYMNAITLMKGRGGWPLNVIALPDGRPVWAETYVEKENWIRALQQVQDLYEDSPERLVDYAARLEAGIKSLDLVEINKDEIDFSTLNTDSIVNSWSTKFDLKDGGMLQTPNKFMMPNNYHFLLRYAVETEDAELMDYVKLTLQKMAFGGVYDHIGGGFARYSTDVRWHVPHFEKMLYDNAQLVSLYSDAYLVDPNPLYKEVVYGSLQYVADEMTHTSGAFYSSFDADSETASGELEEGAYYIFTEKEIDSLITDGSDLFKDYYSINTYGKWEKDHYVLIRREADDSFLAKNDLKADDFNKMKAGWKKTLLDFRNTRPRPRLDDKSLTSWNGLMLKGYLDAYRVFKEPRFLEAARKNAEFLKTKQIKENGGLWHSYKDGRSTINAYLEDYAAVIDGFISMYEITFEQTWLDASKNLMEYAQEHFGYTDARLFYFTSDEDAQLVSRSIEYRDNVIPASNSIMANNLLRLGHYFDMPDWIKDAQTMLHNVAPEAKTYPSSFSNWLQLGRNFQDDYYELVVVGPNAEDVLAEINKTYIPNKMVAASTVKSEAPLLKGRFVEGETFVYVCVNNTCKLPVSSAAEALPLMGY